MKACSLFKKNSPQALGEEMAGRAGLADGRLGKGGPHAGAASCVSAHYTGCPAGDQALEAAGVSTACTALAVLLVTLPSRGRWLEAGVQGRGTGRLRVTWEMPGGGQGRPLLSLLGHLSRAEISLPRPCRQQESHRAAVMGRQIFGWI